MIGTYRSVDILLQFLYRGNRRLCFVYHAVNYHTRQPRVGRLLTQDHIISSIPRGTIDASENAR